MLTATEYATFRAADYLDDDEVIAEYLTAAAEDENPDVLLSALAEVAKARGGNRKIDQEANLPLDRGGDPATPETES